MEARRGIVLWKRVEELLQGNKVRNYIKEARRGIALWKRGEELFYGSELRNCSKEIM